MDNKIIVVQQLTIDDIVLQNIIFDGFISTGYGESAARIAAERIVNVKGHKEFNIFTGTTITKRRILQAISRYIASNEDYAIMLISDNARDIICSVAG